jgi:hypothetical protein
VAIDPWQNLRVFLELQAIKYQGKWEEMLVEGEPHHHHLKQQRFQRAWVVLFAASHSVCGSLGDSSQDPLSVNAEVFPSETAGLESGVSTVHLLLVGSLSAAFIHAYATLSQGRSNVDSVTKVWVGPRGSGHPVFSLPGNGSTLPGAYGSP